MSDIGLHIGPNVEPNDAVVTDLCRMNPPTLLMLDGSYRLADYVPNSCLTIGRSMELMRGFVLPDTEAACVDAGRAQAQRVVSAYRMYPKVRAWMLINEPTMDSVDEARRFAAFDAGASYVFDGEGKLYIAGNWAMGTPEPEIIVAYALAFLEWDSHDFGGVVWGYHGYTNGRYAAKWLERRPWELWQPALAALDITMPPIVFTECGYDNGVGYRGRQGVTASCCPDYLRQLPALTPEAIGRCVFGYRMTADWATWDLAGDETVIAAIAEINAAAATPPPPPNGGDIMPTDLAHEIWDMAFRWPELPKPGGYNPNTAIGAYREGHPMLGMPLSNEYTRDTWPVVMMTFAGGVVLSRRSDWKTAAAMTEGDVRTLLASFLV